MQSLALEAMKLMCLLIAGMLLWYLLKRYGTRLPFYWTLLRDLVQVLKPARFSALVVVAAGLLLITDQGEELTRRLGVKANVQIVLFFVCVFFWAFQSWFWARLMLDAVYGLQREVKFKDDDARQKRVAWLIRHLPRFLGFGAYLVAASALAFSSAWLLAALTVGLGTLFYYCLIRRQDLIRKMPGRLRQRGGWFIPAEHVTHYSNLRDLPRAAHFVLVISFLSLVAGTVWVVISPDSFGELFGATATAFFGFSCIVPVGSLLTFWSHQHATAGHHRQQPGWEPLQVSYPVVLSLLLAAVVFGLWVDNHEVRLARDSVSGGAISAEKRSTLQQAVKAWYEALPYNSRNSNNQVPFIIVATAGGGSRAAYWTATVLGALEDANTDFYHYLFAISGVSGGSLGATVYRTLLATPYKEWPEQPKQCLENISRESLKSYECAGQQVLSRDFLGPLVGALLLPDLLQRFIPVSVFPDRAVALEKGFESAWPAAGFPPKTWRGSAFTKLFASPSEPRIVLPALLLNGTHVASGKRIITSTFKIENSAFLDAFDFFDLVKGDVGIATAVLNSARFSYVTPAGTMRRDGEHNGLIVDGGYFENFGAITALQLVRAARDLEPLKEHVRPIFIQISSDPGLGGSDLPDSSMSLKHMSGKLYLSEVLSPIRAMLETRNARGVLAAKQLFEKEPGLKQESNHFHFRLCAVENHRDPALGWVLSQSAEESIRKGLRNGDCGNAKEFSRLKEALKEFTLTPDQVSRCASDKSQTSCKGKIEASAPALAH
jgi:hypothetical protein